ncbi:hypothetical protein SHIRM173S_05025 [Streptomyces hirsutus]
MDGPASLQAEIKDVQAARALAEVMNRRNLVGRIEVSSFHDDAITEIARLVPGVRTALVASRSIRTLSSGRSAPVRRPSA